MIKPISRGAYGRVFLAMKRKTGDLYAVKVLSKADTLRKNQLANVTAEQAILASANNPFVVKLYYSFASKRYLYLVMDFVNGGDLYSLLQSLGRLDEATARAYVAELCLALAYLHDELGVVHRDLKPDNALIDSAGHIVLTDFGLSHMGVGDALHGREQRDASGSASAGGASSSAGALGPSKLLQVPGAQAAGRMGTPDYMSPEILLGTGHDARVDWWSLGVVLFELIVGVTPFNAPSAPEVFGNILRGNVQWPEGAERSFSPEVRDLIGRLLTQDPEQRLGAGGAAEVKAHPFFDGVEWESLQRRERSQAPFVPQLDDLYDTSYFKERLRKHQTIEADREASADFLLRGEAPVPPRRPSLTTCAGAGGSAGGEVEMPGFAQLRKLQQSFANDSGSDGGADEANGGGVGGSTSCSGSGDGSGGGAAAA
ncbi:kinase-like domain-containing protein, partial [Pavlovales sp. CCMP2436]